MREPADENAARVIDGIADTRHQRVLADVDECREQMRNAFLAADKREDFARRIELDAEAPTHPLGRCLAIRFGARVGGVLVVSRHGDCLGHRVHDSLRSWHVGIANAEGYHIDSLSLLCLLLAVDLSKEVWGQVVDSLGGPHRVALLIVDGGFDEPIGSLPS